MTGGAHESGKGMRRGTRKTPNIAAGEQPCRKGQNEPAHSVRKMMSNFALYQGIDFSRAD